MKGTFAATAALVVLAIGGTPTAAVVLDNDDAGASTRGTTASGPTRRAAEGADKHAQPRGGRTKSQHPGPPPWAEGDGDPGQGDKPADQLKGWAGGSAGKNGMAEGRTGAGARGRGGAHGIAVRAWAHCVAQHNRLDKTAVSGSSSAGEGDGERGGAEAAVAPCGERPTPAGRASTRTKRPSAP